MHGHTNVKDENLFLLHRLWYATQLNYAHNSETFERHLLNYNIIL